MQTDSVKAVTPRAPAFGRWSLAGMEAEVARNEVLSRVAVEGLGATPWRVAFARNRFERVEALMDHVVWWIIGLGLPLLIQWPLARRFNQGMAKQFFLNNKQPLTLGLHQLDKATLKSATGRAQLLKTLGLRDPKQLDAVVGKIRALKLGMMLVDLGFMSAKQQLYFWGRNKLTEKWSKQKGFVGEIGQTSESQRLKNSGAIARSEKQRLQFSLINSIIYPFILPLGLYGLLKSGTPTGKGLVGGLKKLLPAFNYHNSIYLTKWVILWNTLFGWNLVGFLYARDRHERREHVMRCAVADVFFFFGDDVFSGLAGKFFQNNKRYKKQLAGIPLYKSWNGIPIGRSLDDVVKDARKTGRKEVVTIAEKLGRWNFRIGILTTAMFLGIGITLINNGVTRRKLAEERQQRALARSPQSRPLQPAIVH